MRASQGEEHGNQEGGHSRRRMGHAVLAGHEEHPQRNAARLQQACGQLQLWDTTTPTERVAHIGEAEIIISNKVVLDAPLLQALAGQIKLICVAATGTNNVDLTTSICCL